ncbi:MAG: hypothetical protein COA58_00655 [Bacteroidetes bacterium]|nr:MAG: hypothetical protein COA58_00655 [Bacteroidota bacterium]
MDCKRKIGFTNRLLFKRIRSGFFIFFLVFLGSNCYAQYGIEKKPRVDTVYYPFYNGIQMVEIDHSSYYNRLSIEHRNMSQMPHWHYTQPIGDEYLFRDSFGRIIKSFNTNLNSDSMETALRKVPFVNTLYHRQTDPKLFENKGSRPSYKSIFNYSIQEYDYSDTLKRNSLREGLIDTLGNIIVSVEFTDVIVVHGDFVVQSEGKWGLITAEKDLLIPVLYNGYDIGDELIFFRDSGKYKLAYHADTKKIISLDAFLYPVFYKWDSLFIVKRDDNLGLINILTNEITIPCEFENLNVVSYKDELVVKAYQKNKFGMFDEQGGLMLQCKYDVIHHWRREYGRSFKVELDGKTFMVEPNRR